MIAVFDAPGRAMLSRAFNSEAMPGARKGRNKVVIRRDFAIPANALDLPTEIGQ